MLSSASVALQQLAQAWNAASVADKASWQALAERQENGSANAMPTRTSAYRAFITHNTTLYAAGRPTLMTAPAQPATPPVLPPLLFQARWQAGALALSLTTSPYASPVLLYAARPLLPGQTVFTGTEFKLIGSLPQLGGQTDITALYAARFHVGAAGYQIALRVVPLTADGFRGAPRPLSATVQVPAAVAATAPPNPTRPRARRREAEETPRPKRPPPAPIIGG